MARYTDNKCKLCRREGMKLFLKGQRCFTDKCALSRRNYPPGVHAQRRSKVTDYGLHLREKQKLKRIYGVLERQFRLYFKEAERLKGNTGENLLQLLERRLNNVVATLGFAPSMLGARQMVAHGHILVNDRKMNVPSYIVRLGDVVTVHARERSRKLAKESIDIGLQGRTPQWLERNEEPPRGKIVGMPTREDVALPVNENLVVEYCSR